MKTRVLALIIVGALGFTAVAFAGVMGYRMFFGASQDEAVALVPEDALVYGNVFLDPSMDQKRAIGDLLEKFPQAPSTDEARNQLVELFDKGLAEIDMSFDEDVDPWLGDQIAGFSMTPNELMAAQSSDAVALAQNQPAAAFLVASDDDDAALEFIDGAASRGENNFTEKSYEGVDYKLSESDGNAVGIVDGYVVVGSESGLKDVVDTSAGEPSLSKNETYTDTIDRLTDDRLATVYFDGRRLTDALDKSGAAPPGSDEALGGLGAFGVNAMEPVGAALFAQSDKVVFESTSTLPEGVAGDLARSADSGLLAELPADSFGALGLSDFGKSLTTFYEVAAQGFTGAGAGTQEDFDQQFEAQTGLNPREDLLSWMGDAGVFVTGTDPNSVAGGLVVHSTDPARSSAAIAQISRLLQDQGLQTEPMSLAGADGFKVQPGGSPQPIVVLAGEKVVVAYGEQAAESAYNGDPALSGSETFQNALGGLGDGFTPSGYFDLNAIRTLAESAGAAEDPDYAQEVKPWLEPHSNVAFGSSVDGDRVTQRLVIGIE
jgi:hypothetical protein